jgi:four helix bundle protein
MKDLNANIEIRNSKSEAICDHKFESLNSKYEANPKYETRNKKRYNLEERTLMFTKGIVYYIKSLPKTIGNIEIGKQLIRSAGSTGANYIEANEALSKKDFIMRIKISKKEAKESLYWLKLTEPLPAEIAAKERLVQEATELMNILGAIYRKSIP